MENAPSPSGLKIANLTRLGLGPINLELPPGEITALMGPSGAGKTMLLRAIADLDPNDGDVFVCGINRLDLTAQNWRKQVVYVPANSGWWEEKVGPHFAGCGEQNTTNLLHKLGLETTALGWDVAHLSTGERQRLGLARAIGVAMELPAGRADVLLLDEPTSGLDEKSREMAEKVILNQAEIGTAVLMVTHDRAQATRMGKRVIDIEKGKLVKAGSPNGELP